MNTVTVVGNLVKDVVVNYSEKGVAVASFVIADNGFANGTKNVIYWNCVMFGANAENFANNFMVGRQYTIKGVLQPNNYEKDGVKHFSVQIVVEGIKNGLKPKAKKVD